MHGITFNRVAGTIFALVAVGHLWRAVQALPVQIGPLGLPLWISWAGFLGASALSAWGFSARR